MNDGLTLQGNVTLQLFGSDGELKQEVTKQNLITNSARQLVIDLLQKAVVDSMQYIFIGSGTVAAAASDTIMGNLLASVSTGTLSQPDAYTDRLVATFASGVGTGAVAEVGRSNHSTTGSLARTVLDVADRVNKGASASLVVTYNITYAAS